MSPERRGESAPAQGGRRGPRDVPRTTVSLSELVSAAAVRDRAGVGLSCGRHQLTFGDLDRASAALAKELRRRGVEEGDAIAIIAATGIEFAVAAHGILRAGAIVVPISPASPAVEASQMMKQARVAMVITDMEFEETAWAAAEAYDRRCGALAISLSSKVAGKNVVMMRTLLQGPVPDPPARVAAGTAAAVLFTSGSQGRPRGAVHSHEGLMWNALCVAREMLTLRREDVLLGAVPLAHSYGFSAVLNAGLLAGCRVELMPHFEAGAAWDLIHQRGVTVLTGVPTMYRRLAAEPRSSRNSDLRLGVVSGSSCPLETARQVRHRMGIPLIERYGMTEASPLTWREVGEFSEEGDVGRPGWGVRIRAIDGRGRTLAAGEEGELEVRAPGMLTGYLDRADTDAAMHDGWLRTGDRGRVREDGGIDLTGRLKDVILRGGYTVSAPQVEAVLLSHPRVAAAAVVGIPDRDLGEEIGAVIVITDGEPLGEAELGEHVTANLAAWKRPRVWRIVDTMPTTGLGKVRREVVRSLLEGEPKT